MKPAQRLIGGLFGSIALLLGLTGNSQAAPGDYTIKNAKSGRCLSVPATSTDFAYLNQFSCKNYADQFWYREAGAYDPDGTVWYKIINRHSGLCLSVDAASMDDNARVTQYPCGGYADQYWREGPYDARTKGYQIRNWNSGKCLAVQDGSEAEAAPVIQFRCGSWTDHYWITV
ncbi:RICIN domain-containing protein [Streptomyces sp. NPDC004728]|uniref:RICIN domain-containing protein n=1 Tax=Streptomyces sp. NPDC004728 TaxID=3154289 RepID=UPI0033A12D3C